MSIPLIGDTTIKVNLGRALHRVPDHVVTAALGADLFDVVGASWFACVLMADGRGALTGPTPSSTQPPEDVCEALMNVAGMLNLEHHEGGHWVTAWAEDRMHILFRDGDGDLLFNMEIDEPWTRVKTWPAEELANRAALALVQAREETRRLDAREGETYRRALGERAPSSVRH